MDGVGPEEPGEDAVASVQDGRVGGPGMEHWWQEWREKAEGEKGGDEAAGLGDLVRCMELVMGEVSA